MSARFLALAWLLLSATACDQCQQSLLTRGNLDRVADVVVVNRDDGTSMAITSNPELEALRVLDLTAGNFVAAPNRFSPLSIPTGPETRQLTLAVVVGSASVDNTRLYALDAGDDAVQVVRLADASGKDGGPAFTDVVRFDVGGSPVDIAAINTGDDTLVAVSLDNSLVGGVVGDGGVAAFLVDNSSDVVTPLAILTIPGSSLGAIVADPAGESFVVADAAQPLAHILSFASGQLALAQSLDVDGPLTRLAAGVVDVGDGDAPVVIGLRSDRSALVAMRLFRPGFREDRYAVLGGAELPSLPLESYVPDNRVADPAPTVCCRGLSDAALAAREATSAFATVWMANGDMVYVALAAESLDGDALPAGRRLVRLIDDDLATLSAPEGVDFNADDVLWVPADGGLQFRPTVSLVPVDNYGSPPFIPLVAAGTALLLTWEGDLPRLQNLGADEWIAATSTFRAQRDLVARGVRVGDIARFAQNDPDLSCTAAELRGEIVAVSGSEITIAVGATFAKADADACLGINTDSVRLTVEAVDAFVVENDGAFVGRLTVDSSGSEDRIALSGAELGFTANAAGLPLRGSKLALPLDAHVTPMGMNLTGASNIGLAALIPTAIAGGALLIPDAAADEEGATVVARRMVFTSGSVDSRTGLPLLMTCDEGETSTARVESFR